MNPECNHNVPSLRRLRALPARLARKIRPSARRPVLGALGVAAALVTLTAAACGSSTPAPGPSTALATASQAGSAATAVQQLTIYVFRSRQAIPGAPDGKNHDTVVPATFAVKVGTPVEVTVVNYDEMPHTITAPSLGLNAITTPGKAFTTAPQGAGATELLNKVTPGVTHFTFTVRTAGMYRWHCVLPCDDYAGNWAMGTSASGPGQLGFMAGYIVGVS